VPGVPVGLRFFLPSAEPLDAEADVGDLILVDGVEDFCALGITEIMKNFGVVVRVIEIGLLEGEGKPRDVIERAFHISDMFPDHGAHGKVAELDAAFLHALDIPLGVVLLLLKGVEDALPKRVRCVGEF